MKHVRLVGLVVLVGLMALVGLVSAVAPREVAAQGEVVTMAYKHYRLRTTTQRTGASAPVRA